MKQIFNACIVSVFLLTCYTACKNSKTDTYTLKMRLQPGDRFKQDLKMNMDMGMMGMLINMKMKTGAAFEVLTGDSANKTIRITYTDMDVQMDKNMPGSNITDSAMKERKQWIVGKSVNLKLGSGNRITDVEGFEQIFSDSLPGPAGDVMKKMFDKENLNNTFGLMFRMYPEKPVKVNDTWNAATTMDIGGMKMVIDMKFTLLSVKDGIANIGMVGKLNDKGSMEQAGVKFEMTMAGTHTGTMQLQLADGYLSKGDYKMDVTGELALMGQKIPMTMKAEGTINGR